jgi:hypothetical protein
VLNSSSAWLDYSDRDRRRALEVVDRFGDEDTRDELGVGVIRDVSPTAYSRAAARSRRAFATFFSSRG